MTIITDFVIFGDFYYAAASGFKDIVVDGIPKIRIKLKPTNPLMKAYEIKYNELDAQGCITKEYNSTNLAYINNDPENRMIFLWCDFNGNETILLKNIDQTWKTLAENSMKEVQILKKALRYYEKLLEIALTQPEQFEAIMDRRYKKKKEVVGTEIIERESVGDLENV